MVKTVSLLQIAALVAATMLNLVTFAPPWMIALPGLGFRRAFVLTQASTASTYIAPGGAAVGVGLAYAILRGWGFGGGSVGLATALTGIWNQLALLGFPAVALALLTLEQEQNALLQTVALIGLAVFVVAIATKLQTGGPAVLGPYSGPRASSSASLGLRCRVWAALAGTAPDGPV